MNLITDANVVISALIADSKTRELIITLEPDLLTPEFLHDEIENYTELIVEKSGMHPDRVAQFIDLLFQYIEVVPASKFHPYIEEAEAAIGEMIPMTCCTSRVSSPMIRTSGATTPTSVSKTPSKPIRRPT